MKTIFYINCTDTGSTGTIIKDIALLAREKNYRSVLCAPNIVEPNTQGISKKRVSNRLFRAAAYRIAKITGNFYGMGLITTICVIRRICKEQADLVHIHCANGSFLNIYRLLGWLKKNRIPTVVTNHAEFFYTGNCDHSYACNRWRTGCGQCPRHLSRIDSTAKWWKKMKKSFSNFPCLTVTSVSPWVFSRSSVSPIMEGVAQRMVMNGVNTDIFHVYKTQHVWKQYGIETKNQRVVLYVTACFYGYREEKGSKYLLQLAQKMETEKVLFIVAGNYLPGVKVPRNVHLLGRITSQQELARLYSAADLTLITSQRETFSMPVAESLCCGTPVVGFQAGGPESIGIEEYTEFLKCGEVDFLAKRIRKKWLSYKTEELANRISEIACQQYSRLHMVRNYISIYEELTGAEHE